MSDSLSLPPPGCTREPVKLVSPFLAGGTSDIMTRMVAGALSKELGQQFIVENADGAGGTIGTVREFRGQVSHFP